VIEVVLPVGEKSVNLYTYKSDPNLPDEDPFTPYKSDLNPPEEVPSTPRKLRESDKHRRPAAVGSSARLIPVQPSGEIGRSEFVVGGLPATSAYWRMQIFSVYNKTNISVKCLDGRGACGGGGGRGLSVTRNGTRQQYLSGEVTLMMNYNEMVVFEGDNNMSGWNVTSSGSGLFVVICHLFKVATLLSGGGILPLPLLDAPPPPSAPPPCHRWTSVRVDPLSAWGTRFVVTFRRPFARGGEQVLDFIRIFCK